MARAASSDGRATAPRRRRTQAERRAASRAALLDAAIECLLEEGYAKLTTRRVAERAGVSQGTQMHYFPTKTRFVAEAVRHVVDRLADELREELRRGAKPDGLEAVLDRLWRVHNGPAFQASLELMVAARTDPELRAPLRELQRDVNRLLTAGAAELFPEAAANPAVPELLSTALATIRGLAMMPPVAERRTIERLWKAAKAQLLELAAARGVELA